MHEKLISFPEIKTENEQNLFMQIFLLILHIYSKALELNAYSIRKVRLNEIEFFFFFLIFFQIHVHFGNTLNSRVLLYLFKIQIQAPLIWKTFFWSLMRYMKPKSFFLAYTYHNSDFIFFSKPVSPKFRKYISYFCYAVEL